MFSLHPSGVFMSFLVLWLSAIAVALQVLLWMLEIIGITAGRQSCGQIPDLPSVTKGMNGKTSFFRNIHIETNAKGRACEFRKSVCHSGWIWISWLANLRYISGTWKGKIKFCSKSKSQRKVKDRDKDPPIYPIVNLCLFLELWNMLREAFEIMFH